MKMEKFGRGLSTVLFLCVSLFLLSIGAGAQESRGIISGSVSDPTGAKIAGANVAAIEVRTGTRTATVSDGSGQYTIPFLAPGVYQIEAQMRGFRGFLRKGIQLASGDHPVVDINLQVGQVTEGIEVTAETPLVDTENSSTGQAITTQQVEEIPLNGRNPMMLTQLAIGVVATGNPALVHPFDNGAAAAWSIGGTPSQTSEILINGSPNATWDNRAAYSPQQDAVQEVRVKAFDTDAAFGHTSSGTINLIMKTGTNNIHGSLYEFTQPSVLGANSFFNNQKSFPQQVTHFNQYGLTIGGPVRIPKLYDGRNKLFWFFAWETLTDGQPNTNITTVPTDAERHGDFSALLAAGANYQIFNPFTGVVSGNTVKRQPFNNNIIPTGFINPIAQAYLQFYPEPNVPGRADGFQNYANTSTTTDDYSNELGRLDFNMSQRNRISLDVRHNDELQEKNNFFGNLSTGSKLTRQNWGASLDDVFMMNYSTVLDVRLNYTRLREAHPSHSAGFDPTTLGFPSSLASSSQLLQLPFIGFAGSCGSQTSYQCLGDSGASLNPSQSYQLFGALVKTLGSHILKFGGDVRQYRVDNISYGNSAGSFTFSTNWTRGPNASSGASPLGQDFASFLLGLPTGGSFDVNASSSFQSYYYAGFVQDDWRIRRNLTLNLGIRYDHDNPYVENSGKTVNGFAAAAASPVSAAAILAYNKKPITQIPVGSFAVPGGLTFATPDNGAAFQNKSHIVSPRVGFAWSPGFLGGDNTVVRGGFGIFVEPITIANLSVNGSYSTAPIINQEGFSQSTQFLVPSNFLSPTTQFNNPFPNGIQQPVGAANGLGTFMGQTISFLNPEMQNPYSLRWTFGIQHSFTPNLLMEVSYIGNHAVHLPVSVTQLNVIPRQFLSTLSSRDQNLITTLTGSVSNPFAGLLPGTNLNGSTTTVAQLLATFPEFPVGSGSGSTGVIEQNLNSGSSSFHSLNVRLEKRLSHGLLVIGNYGFSKLIEQDSWLNDTDTHLEKRISPFDRTHHVAAAVTYQLPFGKGKAVNLESRWANLLAGGWGVNSIYSYQTGAPIEWVNGSSTTVGDYVYLGGPLNLDNRQFNGTAFDTTKFNTNSAQQFQFHIRTFPTTFGNLRQDSANNVNASLLKRFDITERAYLQLRFEAFNLFNHTQFAAPNVTATSSAFGTITSQANLPREIQIGGRLVF